MSIDFLREIHNLAISNTEKIAQVEVYLRKYALSLPSTLMIFLSEKYNWDGSRFLHPDLEKQIVQSPDKIKSIMNHCVPELRFDILYKEIQEWMINHPQSLVSDHHQSPVSNQSQSRTNNHPHRCTIRIFIFWFTYIILNIGAVLWGLFEVYNSPKQISPEGESEPVLLELGPGILISRSSSKVLLINLSLALLTSSRLLTSWIRSTHCFTMMRSSSDQLLALHKCNGIVMMLMSIIHMIGHIMVLLRLRILDSPIQDKNDCINHWINLENTYPQLVNVCYTRSPFTLTPYWSGILLMTIMLVMFISGMLRHYGVLGKYFYRLFACPHGYGSLFIVVIICIHGSAKILNSWWAPKIIGGTLILVVLIYIIDRCSAPRTGNVSFTLDTPISDTDILPHTFLALDLPIYTRSRSSQLLQYLDSDVKSDYQKWKNSAGQYVLIYCTNLSDNRFPFKPRLIGWHPFSICEVEDRGESVITSENANGQSVNASGKDQSVITNANTNSQSIITSANGKSVITSGKDQSVITSGKDQSVITSGNANGQSVNTNTNTNGQSVITNTNTNGRSVNTNTNTNGQSVITNTNRIGEYRILHLHLLIRVHKGWSLALDSMVRSIEVHRSAANTIPNPQLLVRGPYRSLASSALGKKHVLLVASNTGITPMLSMWKQMCRLAHTNSKDEQPFVRTVHLLWCVTNVDMFTKVMERIEQDTAFLDEMERKEIHHGLQAVFWVRRPSQSSKQNNKDELIRDSRNEIKQNNNKNDVVMHIPTMESKDEKEYMPNITDNKTTIESKDGKEQKKYKTILNRLVRVVNVTDRINLKSVCARSLIQMQKTITRNTDLYPMPMHANIYICGPKEMKLELLELKRFYNSQSAAETYIRICSVRTENM